MTGLVIADDELLIRQGLQSIPWSDYDIELKGIAANGMEALSIMECTFPDILLTDIRMPGMDGLKLIHAAKEILPDIKAILLTGYQDFNYAHSAIQLGAIGYILKPSDPDEIIRTVLKAKEQIDNENMEKREREKIQQQISGVRSILLHSFLLDLLFGRLTDEKTISENCLKFDLALDNCIVLVVETEFGRAEPDSRVMTGIREEIRNISSGRNRVHTVDINPNAVGAVIEFPPSEKPETGIVLSMAAGIQNHLESVFDILVDIGIGMRCDCAAQLHKSCNQALNCLKMKASTGGHSVTHIDGLVGSLKERDGHSREDVPDNAGAVRNVVVKSILDYIDANYMNDISLMTVSEYVYMNHIYLSRLIKKETGENFIDILTGIRMKKACEMLRDCSLKTYEIADRVGIRDSGYFSQVFRKHFGMTPSEYKENIIFAKRTKL